MHISRLIPSIAAFALATLATTPTLADQARDLAADTVTDLDGAVLDSIVYFEFDKTELSDRAIAELDKAASWMKAHPDAFIVIEGHTDKVGDVAYNRKLSDARAETTRAHLIDAGVAADRIRVVPYGEARPIKSTDDKARANRRIRVYSVHDKPVVMTVRVPDPVPAYVPVERTVIREVPALVPLNYAVTAGGGVVQSLDGNTRDVADVGGTWNVRFTAGTRALLGGEIAYIGLAQDVDDRMGLGDSATLIANGAEGAFRLGLPESDLQPYAFAGVGMMRYAVLDSPAAIDDDNVVFFPAGVGLAYRTNGLVIDLRGTARAAFDDQIFDRMTASSSTDIIDTDIADPSDPTERGLENWSASAQLGFEF